MTERSRTWEEPGDLSRLQVGDRIQFAEYFHAYTVQARSERFLVCTKPFAARRTVMYTVIDLKQNIRGTENLVFGLGAETRQQCEEMVARLEGSDPDRPFQTEVSHRNRVPLRVNRVRRRASPDSESSSPERED